MAKLILTKQEVSTRQMVQAIALFFDSDPIPAYSLAAAANEILRDLLGRGEDGRDASVIRDNQAIDPNMRKEWVRLVNGPANFMKHADRDANSTLEFNTDLVAPTILDCLIMQHRLGLPAPYEGMVFFTWFQIKFPRLMREELPFVQTLRQLTQGINPDEFNLFRILMKSQSHRELYDQKSSPKIKAAAD